MVELRACWSIRWELPAMVYRRGGDMRDRGHWSMVTGDEQQKSDKIRRQAHAGSFPRNKL